VNVGVSETLIPHGAAVAHATTMRIDRLFHVLVVHGSLLVAGCDENGGPGEDGASAEGDGSGDDGASDSTSATTSPTEPPGTDATDDAADDGPASTDGGPASTDDGPASTDDGPASTDDGPASTDDGAGSGSSSGEPPELTCSTPASPNDTCGCPCCWVRDCINTDECCAGFSELCTPAV
jgi:hypothetical protein